ncbi:MAG: hypothetical protein R6V83_05190 [Candidatus Thorarchaeota archaeon]
MATVPNQKGMRQTRIWRSFDAAWGVISAHRLFLVVLVISGIVWTWIFSQAIPYFEQGTRPFRAAWNGAGSIDILGYTLHYEFEGWADYDYYYVSWAKQFLNGHMPYTESFETIVVNGTEYAVPYFFPPLFLYLCVIGAMLPIHPYGIGALISFFGFITAFPIYGITNYLAQNRNRAALSAATYLLNPLVLYHTSFEWLNPAPFVFFSFLGFYLLMKQHRILGTLAVVTAALFKQTAFFFGLPLLAYLLKRAPNHGSSQSSIEREETDESEEEAGDELDLLDFAKVAILVLLYAIILSFPYVFNPSNYLHYVFQRAGAILLDDLSSPPAGNQPITLAVFFIVVGAPPELTQIVNLMNYYSIALLVGLLPLFALMLFEKKNDNQLTSYWKRLLFLTMLLVMWVHLWSPRGIYKYYLVLLIPFLCIFSAFDMCSPSVAVSKPRLMSIISPLIMTALLLIPSRNIYLGFLLLIFLLYALRNPLRYFYRHLQEPLASIKRLHR